MSDEAYRTTFLIGRNKLGIFTGDRFQSNYGFFLAIAKG